MKNNSIFIYMAADNDLIKKAEVDKDEIMSIGSDDNLDILIEVDRPSVLQNSNTDKYPDFSERLYVKRGTVEIIERFNEINSGNYKSLNDFVRWSLSNYKAKRNILILWSHAGGVLDNDIYGNYSVSKKNYLFSESTSELISTLNENDIKWILKDDSSRDYLDMIELKKALSEQIEIKFDIIGFDACLMSMFEVYYQIRDNTNYFIGSQEIVPGSGWPYERVIRSISQNPTIDNNSLSIGFIASIKEHYNSTDRFVTFSAFSSEYLEEIAILLDDLSEEFLLKYELLRKALKNSVLMKVQRFMHKEYIDLYHFCFLCRENIDNHKIKDVSNKIMDKLNGSCISNYRKGTIVKDAFGISIMFTPTTLPDERAIALYEELDFVKDHPKWYEFVMKHIEY